MPDPMDTLLYGYRALVDSADAELPTRSVLKITGAGVTSLVDDPANKRSVLTLSGGGGGGFTAGGDLSGNSTSQQVIGLTGVAGTLAIAATAALLQWAIATVTPTLAQAAQTAASTNGQPLTVQAQNASGATSTGGALRLTSGTGTTAAGNVQIQTGGTDRIVVSPTLTTISTSLALSGTVATTGTLRVAHGFTAYGRNNAGNADRRLIDWGGVANDQLYIGDASVVSTCFTASNNGIFRCSTFFVQDAAGTFDFLVADTTTGYVRIGATNPATTGTLRLASGAKVGVRNTANSGNLIAMQIGDGFDSIYVGSDNAFANTLSYAYLVGSTAIGLVQGGSTRVYCTSSGVQIYTNGDPLIFGNGSGLSTAGLIRTKNNPSGGVINVRNAADTSNLPLLTVDASDNMQLWGTGGAHGHLLANVNAGTNFGIQDATHIRGLWTASAYQNTYPIIGSTSESKPYGVHGVVLHTFASDANYTVPNTQYVYDYLQFSTGSWTTGHTVTFPAPAAYADSYEKTIHNNTAYTITVSTGTGSTKTLATGLAQRFNFNQGGVVFASPTWTP